MSRRHRAYRAPEGALASVAGGAVTRERLLRTAQREGRGGSPIIRRLCSGGIPGAGDLARAYAVRGGAVRIDAGQLTVSPKAARLIDPALCADLRCVPVEILEDLCVLAVEPGSAERAVRTVRAALQRDVVPVMATPTALDRVLVRLEESPCALRLGALRSKDSPVHARFRALVLEGEVRDALKIPEESR